MAMIPGVLPQDARTYFEELVDVHKNQKSVSSTAPQGRELADSKRLLKYRSFPSFGCGFDSHRPLHNSRCFNCPYTANLLESALKIDRFGPQMDPAGFNWTPPICSGNRPVVRGLALRGTRRARPRGRNWASSPHEA